MKEYTQSGVDPIEYIRAETLTSLEQFKLRFGVNSVIALSGGADVMGDEATRELFSEVLLATRELSPAVLTGGTKGGIPELGLRVARDLGIPTIGVFPQKGRKNALFELIDLPIETMPPNLGSPTYGTETPTFATIPDVTIIIGGSFGTLTEISTMLKFNGKKIEDHENPIYLCPVEGSGGVADMIRQLVELKPGAEVCLPTTPVRTGEEIASFMRQHLLYN